MEAELQLTSNRVQDENASSSHHPESSTHRHQERQPATGQPSHSHLEALGQVRRLEEELEEIKIKWEHALASTVEQQISVHRQRLRDRESVIAQQDAELNELRRGGADAQCSVEAGPHSGGPTVGRSHSRSAPRYSLSGRAEVGQTLQVEPCNGSSITDVTFQWYRVLQEEDWEAISGASRRQYSPEPYDCGCVIGCYVLPVDSTDPKSGSKMTSSETVGISRGLLDWVETAYNGGVMAFGVIVVQRNGMLHTNREVCSLKISRQDVTLQLQPYDVTIQQSYSSGMQVCGARGAGNAAAQGLFLSLRGHEVYMLACKTAYERNACILLIRKMAALHGLDLRGPE